MERERDEARALPQGIKPASVHYTLSRSLIDRAIRLLEQENIRDALIKLRAVAKVSDQQFNGGDIER